MLTRSLLVWFACTSVVWADTVVYYDSATGALVGTYTATTVVDSEQAGQQFGLGANVHALRLSTLPPKAALDRYVVKNGLLQTEVDTSRITEQSTKEKDYQEASDKLESLGFTKAHIKALTGK